MPANYSVIVPTLNEVDNIDPLVERLLALPGFVRSAEVIFVDDGSTDGTVDKVRQCCGRGPIRLLQRSGAPDLSRAVFDAVAADRKSVV